jgi:hypothetical protein
MSVDMGEALIRSVDWNRYRISTGRASDFGDRLLGLLHASTPDESRVAWQGIENFVFAQDTIFSAAEPTIDVILAALVNDRPSHVKITLIDLLFLILNGDSNEEPDLHRRCRASASRGIWLLAREASLSDGPIRDSILEAMELIDADRAEALRALLDS